MINMSVGNLTSRMHVSVLLSVNHTSNSEFYFGENTTGRQTLGKYRYAYDIEILLYSTGGHHGSRKQQKHMKK